MPYRNYPDLPQSEGSEQRLTAFQTTLIAGGLVLFLFLLYEMRDFLNPPLVAGATLVLLWPVRSYTTARAILITSLLLIIFWFLDELAAVIGPFALVYLFAYLFDPAVTALNDRYNVPRWISSLVATILAVGAIVVFIFLLVPSIVAQFEVLAQRSIELMAGIPEWLRTTTILDNLVESGIIESKQQVIQPLTQFVQQQATALARSIPEAVQRIISSISTLIGIITVVTVMPVVHYYTLKDYPYIKRRIVELFPTFGGRRDYLIEAGGIVGSYLRGQLAICAIAAFNVSVVLLILDAPFALLIGLLAGLLNLIPNLGIIITNIIGILVGLIFGEPWYLDVLKIVLVLLGQSFLEQALLTPKIMSHQVGLHPVLIILSLFIFGYFLGWFGLLIAVPATALLMTAYKTYRDKIQFELTDPGNLASTP